MDLYIMRHGIAAELGAEGIAEDSARPLTAQGEKRVRRIARSMKRMGLGFDLIVSSPFLRAKQTAALVAARFDAKGSVKLSKTLAIGGDPRGLLRLIARRRPVPERVLIVGHEPYLSELIGFLLAGEAGLAMALRKGGLCKLTVPQPTYGRGATLEWLLTPKQMLLMCQ